MAAPFTLYVDSLFLSPYALSAFVALTEKQLPFEIRLVDLSAGEHHMVPYQNRSLTSRVPAMTHEGFHLTESSAIAEYLEDMFPAPGHAALYPSGAQERAKARQIQAWLRSDLLALRQERSTEAVFYAPDIRPLSDSALVSAAKLIQVAGALLRPGQVNLFDAWSVVDIDLAVMLNRLAHSGDELPEHLRDYAAAQWRRPSVQKWLEHNAAAKA